VPALLCFFAAVYFSGRERQCADESLRLRNQLGDRAIELRRWQDALAMLNAPSTTDVTFGGNEPAAPMGRIFVDPSGGVVLFASHLPPARDRQALRKLDRGRNARFTQPAFSGQATTKPPPTSRRAR
jgi:hypothetical protein